MTIALLLLAGLGGVVLLTEIVCRLWLRLSPRIYVFEPYYHIEMDVDPAILPHQSPHVRVQMNHLGARGDEPPTAGKVYRILTTGGSAVECASLDQDETWGAVAETLLNRPENRARLGVERVYLSSIGKSGFTTDALVYSLPRILPRFGPLDLLTIMLGTSAVNTWTRLGTPDVLPPDSQWDELAWHPHQKLGWHPKNSATREVYRRIHQCLARPVIRRTGVGRGLAKSRKLRQNARELRDTHGDPTQWLRHYETTLAQAVASAKPHARRVVLIRQPWYDTPNPSPEEAALFWHGSVGDASQQFADVFYTHRVLCDLMKLIDEATVRVGERLGIEVWRPAEVITAAPTTFYDHFHFARAGARVMGEYVADHVLAGEPLREPS